MFVLCCIALHLRGCGSVCFGFGVGGVLLQSRGHHFVRGALFVLGSGCVDVHPRGCGVA